MCSFAKIKVKHDMKMKEIRVKKEFKCAIILEKHRLAMIEIEEEKDDGESSWKGRED